jgi:hypothetical protein
LSRFGKAIFSSVIRRRQSGRSAKEVSSWPEWTDSAAPDSANKGQPRKVSLCLANDIMRSLGSADSAWAGMGVPAQHNGVQRRRSFEILHRSRPARYHRRADQRAASCKTTPTWPRWRSGSTSCASSGRGPPPKLRARLRLRLRARASGFGLRASGFGTGHGHGWATVAGLARGPHSCGCRQAWDCD